MKILNFLVGERRRKMRDDSVSGELDEKEQQLAEQQRRLQKLRHLSRERDLYRRPRPR